MKKKVNEKKYMHIILKGKMILNVVQSSLLVILCYNCLEVIF